MHPALTEACAADANRAGPSGFASPPRSVVDLIALLIRHMLRCIWTACLCPYRVPSWWHDRPDLPLGSAQALAASIRGNYGNQIAWTCLRDGIGPGHPDWPELSRAIVAFGGSVRRFRAGDLPWGLQWWENPGIVPGLIGRARATPAAGAMALLLLRQARAHTPSPVPETIPAEAIPALPPAPKRRIFARTATGPPTGPPGDRDDNSVAPDTRGHGMAGPAILIRAAATISWRSALHIVRTHAIARRQDCVGRHGHRSAPRRSCRHSLSGNRDRAAAPHRLESRARCLRAGLDRCRL